MPKCRQNQTGVIRCQSSRRLALAVILAGMGYSTGCQSPMEFKGTAEIEKQIVEANRNQSYGDRKTDQVEPTSVVVPIEDALATQSISGADRLKMIDSTTGPQSRRDYKVDPGIGLDGKSSLMVKISIQQAVSQAVANNLENRAARLGVKITRELLESSKAIFDPLFFAEGGLSLNDEPTGSTLPTKLRTEKGGFITAGVAQRLDYGTQLALSSTMDYRNSHFSSFNLSTVDPAFNNDITLSIEQPLLRGFGRGANRSQIMLAENTALKENLRSIGTMLRVAADVEAAYWELLRRRQEVAIYARLVVDSEKTYEAVIRRAGLDATGENISQTRAFLEKRKSDYFDAIQDYRSASDILKRLISSPQYPLADETLLDPTDWPSELTIKFDLAGSLNDAIRHRPDVREAAVNIDDAAIRQALADNQRLPLLNVGALWQLLGLANGADSSFSEVLEGDFQNYSVGVRFEQPIGNRLLEHAFRAARLERQQSLILYQNVLQEAVLDVKLAMRDIQKEYNRIGILRNARRARAAQVDSLEKQQEAGVLLSAQFLDRKLRAQQSLSDAEIDELQAMTNYNTAIIRLHEATGTLLSRKGIDFVIPESSLLDNSDPKSPAVPPRSATKKPADDASKGGPGDTGNVR